MMFPFSIHLFDATCMIPSEILRPGKEIWLKVHYVCLFRAVSRQMRVCVRYGCPNLVWAKNSKTKCFLFNLLSFYEFWNFIFWLVLSKLPSCCTASNRFYMLSEVFSYSKLLYGLGQNILRTRGNSRPKLSPTSGRCPHWSIFFNNLFDQK